MSASGGLLDLLIRSSLLLAMIWCAAAGVRKAGGSAAMRHMVWLLGLGALFLFPFVTALMPPLRLSILPVAAASPPEIMMAAAAVAAPAGIGAVPVESLGLGDLFELFYLTVAAGLLGRLALGHYVLARLWRRARPASDARWLELLDGLKSALGIRRPVALRIAAGPAMPMTWATLRPRILLPAEAAGWTAERRRIVLMHELAHVARRDSFSRSAAAIVCAFYWLHPAIWYAARRMRLEQEHACDDLVLSLGASASAYARNLLDVARAFRPPPIATSLSVAMARSSELERRLTAIIRRGPRRRPSARFVTGSGAGALAATLLAATVVPVAALQPAPVRGSYPMPATAPPAVPARSVARPALVPQAPVAAAGGEAPIVRRDLAPAKDYDQMLERYLRDREAYSRELEGYERAVDAHHHQVAELRARGNLANTGNTGNSGNSGNSGNPGMPARPGQPAVPPTPPTPPTAPTWPTPPTPLQSLPVLPQAPKPPT